MVPDPIAVMVNLLELSAQTVTQKPLIFFLQSTNMRTKPE